MNRQKKQKQRKISSSSGASRSRPVPISKVQMEILGRPMPETIEFIDSLGPQGYRSLRAYRMLLRHLLGAAQPILQAKFDWRVAADVPSTVWTISKNDAPENSQAPKYMFAGLRNMDGHDIEQVRGKMAFTNPGTIVVRPRPGGEVWFQFDHVGLGGREVYVFKHQEGWRAVAYPSDGADPIALMPDGSGRELGAASTTPEVSP